MLWVGIGGIIGALLRYQISKWVGERWVVSFPVATLFINVSGAFLLGLFTRYLAWWFPAHHSLLWLVFAVGGCGAYTTFSTFSYELVILLRERRFQTAGVYALSSFLFGFAASAVGLYEWP